MTPERRRRTSQTEDVLQTAQNIMESHRLCDNCLGRQFGNLASGTSNLSRGAALKLALLLKAHMLTLEDSAEGRELLEKLASNGMLDSARATMAKCGLTYGEDSKAQCELCEGKLSQLDSLASRALEAVFPFEFDTFLVGAVIPAHVMEAEDKLRAKFSLKWGETIKSEFTREIGKIIASRMSKAVDFKSPDVAVTIHPYGEELTVQANPLYVYGRYRKLVVGIPQSTWTCGKCRGRGCDLCEGTGLKYRESVQELISKPLLEASGGEDTRIHASGREDIDAKVLGSGRPFVIEIKNPRKRNFPLESIASTVNSSGKVEVEQLKRTTKATLRRLKDSETAEKSYRAVVEVEGGVGDAEIERVQKQLNECLVKQQTPRRVVHRRADRLRERYIYEAKTVRLTPTTFEINIRCQGGLYVKELVHGDEGRTTPSVAEILEKNAKCLELAVLDIQAGGAE